MKISIIIPVYNEENTIIQLINKILKLKELNKELLIVDDGSTDRTLELVGNFRKNSNVKILIHKKNQGKGAAIKTAKKKITGDIIIIQDGDLEYDPRDYIKLIEPIINNKEDVVYGSRVLNNKRYDLKNFTSIFRIFANHMLTIISNIINKQKLTDAHTCYKTFTREVFDMIYLEENDFAFCPEITTKISLLKKNIQEVPINYQGRSYKDGKKIKFTDGIKAIKCLIKYRYFKS